MANTISSVYSSVSTTSADLDAEIAKMAPTYQTQINAAITAASQPLNRVQAQKDAATVTRAIYTDMKTNLDALQSAVQGLITTQGTYGLNLTAKPTVTPGTVGTTVLTATASDSAVAGNYDISVTDLARAHTQSTAAGGGPDLALGKSGTFWLGGTGTASVNSFTPSASVTSALVGSVASGQQELGSTLNGTAYSLQVRDYDGTRQFRLVDADGNAVSIQKTDNSGYTSSWQGMANGFYDTGRGLQLNLSKAGDTGSTAISYTARGTSIAISSTDTMRTIAKAINSAVQPEGHDFTASIVSNALVLTGAQTGVNHSMVYTDGLGLGFSDLQTAQNATFSINGMNISRASNTNLTDVIDGVILSLAGDAKGKTANLNLAVNSDKAASTMSTLVKTFNAAVTQITQKMAITPNTSGATTSYTRGPLNGDSVTNGLRTDLYSRISQSYANSGSFKHLSDIGIGIDSNLQMTFDSAKFADAIQNYPADVTALLDTAMGGMNTMLNSYAGSTGSVQRSIDSIDAQQKVYDLSIARYTQAITLKKQSLYDTYNAMAAQLTELSNEYNMFGILYGNSTSTSTSSSGSLLSTTG